MPPANQALFLRGCGLLSEGVVHSEGVEEERAIFFFFNFAKKGHSPDKRHKSA